MKSKLVEQLADRFGTARKFARSLSLFAFGNDQLVVYFRYSKRHNEKTLFYGLRAEDLRQLQGKAAVICFLWDGQLEPVFVPFEEFEEVFRELRPARDGQYKVHIRLSEGAVDLSLPTMGRFSIDGYVGWEALERRFHALTADRLEPFTHSQVQTLLCAIGWAKNFDVWTPASDRTRILEKPPSKRGYARKLPDLFERINPIISEVDVIWIERGAGKVSALFEIEHSTTIYSGLLRFNDIRLVAPQMDATYSIVADDERRARFVRQLNRPTFQRSGLSDTCTFMKYEEVYSWHQRTALPAT
jgi:hypothetical protein